MLFIAVVALLGACASAFYEPTLEHFELWADNHNKVYETHGEKSIRTLVWLDNVEFVKKMNAENNGVTYKMNEFGDLTHEEYLAKLSPVNEEEVELVKKTMPLFSLPPWLQFQAPTSKDWRDSGAVTGVKNQGTCGSCYSFSTTGALEGACFLKTGQLKSFSEQQIMDCSWAYSNNGCNGGMYDRSFYYINKAGGIMSEADYPYTMQESHTCKFDESKVAGAVSTFYYVKQDEASLTAVLGTAGPVSVAINAGMRDFQFYHDGVYDNPSCDQQLNHGVLAVGYGVENGKPYYLVKNSWGTSWGLQGYIKMSRNGKNQCGIATYPVIPVC